MGVHLSLSPNLANLPLNQRLLVARTEQLQVMLELPQTEVSLVLLSDEEMAAYNEQYRQKQGPTNVLSFPANEGDPGFIVPDNELGDILISVDTARREAVQEGHSLHHRILELIIHGMLH